MQKTESIRTLKTSWLIETPKGAEKRPVLVFLHGCPDDAHSWKSQFEFFSKKGFTVVAPFVRGIGKSEATRQSNRYSPEAIAFDTLEILRESGIESSQHVCVIGHDLGGPPAVALARLLADRLHSLVLIDAPDTVQLARRFTNWRQLKKSWYIGFFQIPFLSDFFVKKNQMKMLKRAARSTGYPGAETNPGLLPFIPQYRQAFRAVPRLLTKALPKLKAPVLILWGKDDAFLEPPTVDEYGYMSDAVTVRVLDGHHWLHHQHPERVNGLIEKFLEQK